MCIYVHHMHVVPMEARKKALDPLELELYMVMNSHVSSRN